MRQSIFVTLCFSKIVDAAILFRLQVIQSVTLFPQGKSCDALELSTVMSFITSPLLRAFGNAMAGYLAKLMGLPIDRIVCATNANDIVHRTLTHGDMRMTANLQVLNFRVHNAFIRSIIYANVNV
jgi:hypothetical protein